MQSIPYPNRETVNFKTFKAKITMGSTRMTPYRIKAYFVDFQNKCHGVATFGSDMKNPTPAKLQDWRKNYNASMEPG